MSGLSDFAGRLQALAKELQNSQADILLVAAVRTNGFLKRRIFNEGLATDGAKIGEYSKTSEWIEIRQKRGRQVGYVDLQFTGELFESIQAGTRGQSATIEIKNRENQEKARKNENIFRKKIFELGQNEIEQAELAVQLEVSAIIKKWLS
jgi:hypothetical protein